MSRIYLYGIVVLAIAGAVTAVIVGVYHKGYDAGSASIKTQWEAASRAEREREEKQAAQAAADLENARAKEHIVNRTITQTVEKLVDRPVYRNVCLDADGVCIVNAAIRGEGADSCKPADAVPGTRSTARWDRGLGLALDDGSSGVLSGLRREAQVARGGG